jgi:hypothetical protein
MRGGRRLLVGIGLAVTLGWAVGCGDSTAPADLPGHYVLHAVNGASPPATVTHQDYGFVFRNGFLDFTATDTFTGELSMYLASQTMTASYSGRYRVSGSTVNVRGFVVFLGTSHWISRVLTASGQDITMVDNTLGFDVTLVFSKQ